MMAVGILQARVTKIKVMEDPHCNAGEGFFVGADPLGEGIMLFKKTEEKKGVKLVVCCCT